MAAKKQGGNDRRPGVVRRPPTERKRLAPELEAFAGGDDDALWRRERRGGRLDDPRPGSAAAVAGVANRDARLVFDARVKRMRAAIERGDEQTLGEELLDAVRLALWRANNVIGFDVLAEAVLGVASDKARALAHAAAERLGEKAAIEDEVTLALWMRTEAGLLEHAPDASVRLLEGRLYLEVPLDRAAAGLAGVGRRAAPMVQVPVGTETVVDRPQGVAPLSKIIERDRPKD